VNVVIKQVSALVDGDVVACQFTGEMVGNSIVRILFESDTALFTLKRGGLWVVFANIVTKKYHK